VLGSGWDSQMTTIALDSLINTNLDVFFYSFCKIIYFSTVLFVHIDKRRMDFSLACCLCRKKKRSCYCHRLWAKQGNRLPSELAKGVVALRYISKNVPCEHLHISTDTFILALWEKVGATNKHAM